MDLDQRAGFSSDLQPLRSFLPTLLPVLGKKGDWYPSIWFERKSNRSMSVNLKQTQVSDSFSSGVVLRIYDGYTLHEQASDDLEPSRLRQLAEEFAARVQGAKIHAQAISRPYPCPSWRERLKQVTEKEILDQIGSLPAANQEVHFGVRFQKDPRGLTVEEATVELKALLKRILAIASEEGLPAQELSYALARYSLAEEESLFIDSSVNISQTLLRVAVTLVTMSGANRSIHRVGGLGGVESLAVHDSEILEMISDLKALKNAQRLAPGKYRVLFGPELSGVIAHEAFGHAQEGDTCARGRSRAWELHQSGEKVGNQNATIVNNPAIFKNADRNHAAWGSYYFDEEGWFSSEQVLLKEGVLQSPMTNLTSALRLGVPRTSNGKRETWANGVYTRQTNTYFSPGPYTLADLMKKLGDGFVATQAAGGMEDPKGMGIQVGLGWLREVKDGALTGRVFRGAAGGDIQLTGYVPDVLNSIVAKSKIEAESEAPDTARFPLNDSGGCGKYHKEFVNAGCGGPWMLLENVTLG